MCRLVSSDDNIDTNDFRWFFILYKFIYILFNQTNYTSPLILLSYVDNLDLLTNYNWTMIVHSYIIIKIFIIDARIKKMKFEGSTKIIEYLREAMYNF